MKDRSFYPPRRTLLGPGPSDVPPRVLAATALPTIGHLDPAFLSLMDSIQKLCRYAFETANEATFPISGPASAGMEACFANLVEPGDTVVVMKNGFFGERMVENVVRAGGTPVTVEDDWGAAADPQKLEDALRANPRARLVAFVHAETSTGVLSDARLLTEVAHRYDCLVIADAVTSLGGSPLMVDEWGIDAVYAGSQKCLSAPPGLSPVSFGPAARARIEDRESPPRSWFLDLTLLTTYWSGAAVRSYHHTAPVNALYGLHEALLMLKEEGLEKAWRRHKRNHEALRDGLLAMGLELAVPEEIRLPQLNAVVVPEGVDEAAVRRRLLEEHGLEIGGGLGYTAGRVWRIGLMGHSSCPRNVMLCLAALEHVLSATGADIHVGAAAAAAEQRFVRG